MQNQIFFLIVAIVIVYALIEKDKKIKTAWDALLGRYQLKGGKS